MIGANFFFDGPLLAERVEPTCGPRRRPYVHRCALETFVEVVHRCDECDDFTLEELGAGLPNSQVALALRFLREWGLIDRVHARRSARTEDSIHLSAMTCWHFVSERGGDA